MLEARVRECERLEKQDRGCIFTPTRNKCVVPQLTDLVRCGNLHLSVVNIESPGSWTFHLYLLALYSLELGRVAQ